MTRGGRYQFNVITLGVILLVSDGVVARGQNPSSYLSAAQLLDLYRSMYSSIHNMHVSYTHVQEGMPSPENPAAFDRLVPCQRIDRIEEGDKYYERRSTDPDGFDRSDQVTEHAFDGSVTMDYFGQDKSGRIVPGRTGRNTETTNDVLLYMLLDRFPLPEDPDLRGRLQKVLPEDARTIDSLVSRDGKVRPLLEQVAGEWCHVVDTYHPYLSEIGCTAWFAADKGGLPLRYEKYGHGGACVLRVVVEQVGAAETETGTVWYPREFTVETERNDGKITHRITSHELQVNIPTNEDTWRLSFPDGTDVIDQVLGISYTTGSGEAWGSGGAGSDSAESRNGPLPDDQGGVAIDHARLKNAGDMPSEPNDRPILPTEGDNSPMAFHTRKSLFMSIGMIAAMAIVATMGVFLCGRWCRRRT